MNRLVPCIDNCKFSDLFVLINNVLQYLVYLAVPLGTIAIVAAGIMYVMSAGNEGYRTTAKKILMTAAVGLFLTLAAYLIISSILHYLGNPAVVGSWQ